MTVINYCPSPCGSGKTEWVVNRMTRVPGRYICAIDRTDEYPSRQSRIIAAATLNRTSPIVRQLSSRNGDSVCRTFAGLADEYEGADHVIVLITHEALKLADHGAMEGWTLIIDEDPRLWKSETFSLPVSSHVFREFYDLKPDLEGHAVITVKESAPRFEDMLSDGALKALAPFHARVRTQRVLVNLPGTGDDPWAVLEERRRLTWFMVWNPNELVAYDEIYIVANAFDRLISFRLIQTMWPEIELRPFHLPASTTWAARKLTINYTVEKHLAGTTYFRSEAGQRGIAKWVEWVSELVTPDRHYWSANNINRTLAIPGESISSKIAGSNQYRDLTECSILYSAKPGNGENTVFAALTHGAVTREDVRRDREFEDLIQIAFRSSLRNATDTRPVTLNVYDAEQADFLASYFVQAGFPFEVEKVFVDIGIDGPRSRQGRPKAIEPLTQAERSRRSREKRKALEGRLPA